MGKKKIKPIFKIKNILYMILNKKNKSPKKQYELIVPQNWLELLQSNLISKSMKVSICWFYYTLMSKIAELGDDATKFVRLDSRILKRYMGNDYSQIIDLLDSNGFIKIDHSYFVGNIASKGRCKSYGLSNESIQHINNKNICLYTYTAPKSKFTKINIKSKKKLPESHTIQDNKQLIKQTLRTLRSLKIDIKAAFKFIDSQNYSPFAKINLKNQCLAIKNKNVYASINTTNFRLDTNLTNLKTDLLKFIKQKGEHLVSFDLANSQILFFSKQIESIKTINPQEFKEFKRLVVRGDFWKVIQNKLKTSNKRQTKELFFKYWFGPNNSCKKVENVFKSMFPTIHRYILTFKRKNNYKQFSIILQNMESGLFIQTILKKCFYNQLKCFSKHDSILCRESISKEVETIIKEYLDKYFGDYKLNKETYAEIFSEQVYKSLTSQKLLFSEISQLTEERNKLSPHSKEYHFLNFLIRYKQSELITHQSFNLCEKLILETKSKNQASYSTS